MNLKEKNIAIIGFGNQGYAWALNLRDSGLNVKVGLRLGSKSMKKAQDAKFDVLNIKQAFMNSDVICILTPDKTHKELFEKYSSDLDEDQTIIFAHGYNIHYKTFSIDKKVDIALVAPKETGITLRDNYMKDSGVPCLIAVERDLTGNAWQIAKGIAEGLGCHKVGIYKSTFKEETEINLFTEQSLYLSVLPQVILETFNTLVENGYSKEASYYESLHKVKTISELFQRFGLHEGFEKVSEIAKLGGIMSQGRLVNDGFKKEMKKILKEIQDGTFLKKVNEEIGSGYNSTKSYTSSLKDSEIETIGKRLREKIFKSE
jgi:ketol-acid reductoisomerase